MRYRRKKKGLSAKDKRYIFGSVAVLCFLTIPALILPQLSTKKPLDARTFCPTDGEIARTSVLIDKSDKWGKDDVIRVEALLLETFSQIPAQGRLTIYGIVGKGRESTEVKQYFDACNPGTEKECNLLYEDCGAVKERYLAAFSSPLATLSAGLKLPGQASFSPLLESIGEIVDEASNKPLHLLIVSDMMENHYKFRFYDAVPLASEMIGEFPLEREAATSVQLRYIQRSRHSREFERAVLGVWKTYFAQQDIRVSVDRLFVAD